MAELTPETKRALKRKWNQSQGTKPPGAPRTYVRYATALRFEVVAIGEAKVRVLIVRCPYCQGEHQHTWPPAMRHDAEVLRNAKCSSYGTYYVTAADIERNRYEQSA